MNGVEDLEINTAARQVRIEPSVAPAELADFGTKVSKHVDGQSKYTSKDNLALDNLYLESLSEPADENKFNSLFERFKLIHEPDLPRSHAAIDTILTMLCFVTVHLVYLGNLNLSSYRSVALVSALVLLSLSLLVGGMYCTKKLRRLNTELTHLAACWIFAFASIGLFAFLSKTAEDVSRVWITLSMVLSLVSLGSVRILGSLALMARNSSKSRNIVILGNSSDLAPVITDLGNLSHSNIKLAKVFNFPVYSAEAVDSCDSLKSTARQLTVFVENQRQRGAAIEQVWITATENQSRVVQEVSEALINSSVDVCIVPDQYTERLLKGDVTRFGNTDIVNVSEISLSLAANQFKRVFDVLMASLALAVFGVPMMVIALLIKLESSGPALFRQKRYGVDGQEIEIFKFRSMLVHSDNAVQQATRYDARITRVGRIIRNVSLDELPQLLNVLNGTMSLIGPRPHAVAHNESWRHEIQGYMLRHKVRPGITGLAQVKGWRGETDTVFKMQQRLRYDLEYIKNWSPWLDLKILFLTIFVGFFNKNAY